jgi:hypothetical protein
VEDTFYRRRISPSPVAVLQPPPRALILPVNGSHFLMSLSTSSFRLGLGSFSGIRCKVSNNIKIELEDVDWIYLAEVRDKSLAVVKTVNNFWV